MATYEMLGLMSGTSLDGLDIAHIRFVQQTDSKWEFNLLHAETLPYPVELFQELKQAPELSAIQLIRLDKKLGLYFANCVINFVKKYSIDKSTIDAIASHGHTVFHQPEKGFTHQIGCGTTLSFHTEIHVINDFRTRDVVAGGQGAPLVPIGDQLLFHDKAQSFLNIGGFANISFEQHGLMTAFDVCPGNLPLNRLANIRGLDYDKNGELAKSGELNFFLLDLLNNIPFYDLPSPKSLGREWLENDFYPLIKFDKDLENNLRTVIEHEAQQIAHVLNQNELKSVMITGGGAKNAYLIQRLKQYYTGEVILPTDSLIDFKEAIIFGFLGALYFEKTSNTVASVTGASQNVCGGVLHIPI
jgi:anhydro-N-acetylmuramic acid kinase